MHINIIKISTHSFKIYPKYIRFKMLPRQIIDHLYYAVCTISGIRANHKAVICLYPEVRSEDRTKTI